MRNSERLIRLAEAADILACGRRTACRTLAEWGVVPARVGRRGGACTAWRLADVEDVVVRMAARARAEAEAAGGGKSAAKRRAAWRPPRNFEEFAAMFGPGGGSVQ